MVDAVYKVGCRGCDCEEYTAYLCSKCKEEALAVDAEPVTRKIEEIREAMFPTGMEIGGGNVQLKRPLGENEGDASYKRVHVV